MKTRIILYSPIFFSFTFLFLLSCNQPKQTKVEVSAVMPKPVIDTIGFDSLHTDIAYFIAGMPFEGDSALLRRRNSEKWRSFSAEFDSSWLNAKKSRLEPMKKWAEKELKEESSSERPLFYPFSGPDILNATTLFPNSKSYTLVGLEPVGDILDVRKMNSEKLTTYLQSIESSLNDIFRKSYFISKHMLNDLQQENVNGALPLLEVFLARTGNKIRTIELISLNDSGEVTARNTSDLHTKLNRGVRIGFTTSTGVRKTLQYFKVDLEDAGLAVNPAFMKYVKKTGEFSTYLKSASYLLHYKFFAEIRNQILAQSAFLLQDDSGVAYRFFDKKKWKIKLYGQYTEPISDFKGVTQEDLQAAYNQDAQHIEALPFVLGYHWESRGINLMKATRILNP